MNIKQYQMIPINARLYQTIPNISITDVTQKITDDNKQYWMIPNNNG